MADNRMGVDDVVGVHRVRLEVEVETPRAMSKAVSDTLNPPTEENQNEQN